MKKKTLTFLLLLLFMLEACFYVNAGEKVNDDDRLALEKVNRAVSVILASQINSSLPQDSLQKIMFIKGIGNSISQDMQDKQYFYGISNGLAMREKIQSLSGLGLPLEDIIIIPHVESLLTGSSVSEFSYEEANKIVNDYIAEKFSANADTFSVDSQQAFIDSISILPNAQKLESGVILIELETGNDLPCQIGDKVLISYVGQLSDGYVFDSTEEPIEVVVGSLVPGFNEGLLKMNKGGRYRLVIPSSEGYGKEGIPGVIPGNAALDFEVRIINILH